MRKVRADLEMIVAERPSGRGADILHGKGDDDANRKQRETIFPAVKKNGMDQGGENTDRRERLRQRGRIPGKADHQRQINGKKDPDRPFGRRQADAACPGGLLHGHHGPRFSERLVDQRLQFDLNALALRRRLHHANRKHVIFGIDEEERAAGAVPAIFAGRQRRIRDHADGKAETKAAVAAREVIVVAGDVGFRRHMVRRHQGDRLRPEISPAVERTAIEQHLRKARVVGGGTDHPSPAGFPAPPLDRIAESLDPCSSEQSPGNGSAMRARLASSTLNAVSVMPSGSEQPLLFELVQRFSGNDLDDAAENVGRVAVIPQRARLLGERQFREPLGELRIVDVAVEQICSPHKAFERDRRRKTRK